MFPHTSLLDLSPMKRDKASNKYWDKRIKAKDFYTKINKIKCPAFQNELIHFNSYGFTHLIRKNGVLRTIDDQLRRFSLLRYVLIVITDSGVTPSYHKEGLVEFWEFKKVLQRKTIKVIVRRLPNGTRHFFSVMSQG